jgi:hypothetical protein
VYCRQYNFRLLRLLRNDRSYCYFGIKLMSKVIMSYSILSVYSTGDPIPVVYCNGYAIFLTKWMSCEVVWLAWLQLPYRAVVFNILASNGVLIVVTASLLLPASLLVLLLLPAPSASRILSPGTHYNLNPQHTPTSILMYNYYHERM